MNTSTRRTEHVGRRWFRGAAAVAAVMMLILAACTTAPLHADDQAAASAPAPAAPTPPAVGDTAADFTLPTLDGEGWSLYEHAAGGPVVVVMLRGWVTYQCPICSRQVGDFLAHADDLKQAHAQVVFVYPGPAQDLDAHAREFIKGKQFPEHYSFVIDPDLKMVNLYHLRWDAPKETALPSTFVVDAGHVVRFAKISHSHGDRASAQAVLDALAKSTP